MDVVGNRHEVKKLLQWLEIWAGKRRAPRKTKKEKQRAQREKEKRASMTRWRWQVRYGF